jgi:hypothetical protein
MAGPRQENLSRKSNDAVGFADAGHTGGHTATLRTEGSGVSA